MANLNGKNDITIRTIIEKSLLIYFLKSYRFYRSIVLTVEFSHMRLYLFHRGLAYFR